MTEPTGDPPGLITFWELLEDAFLDPDRVDYAQLRHMYAASAHYVPYGRDPTGAVRLHQALATEDWEAAIEVVEELLVTDPLAIALRLAYAHALDGVSDDWEATTQRAVANGLLKSILRSGDGKAAHTAITVLDDRERQLALEMMGTRAMRTRLESHTSGWLEVVSCSDGRTLYFDVTWPQSFLNEPQARSASEDQD